MENQFWISIARDPEPLQIEQRQFHDQLTGMSRYIGELETQLLQLGGASSGDNSLPHGSEAVGKT